MLTRVCIRRSEMLNQALSCVVSHLCQATRIAPFASELIHRRPFIHNPRTIKHRQLNVDTSQNTN